MAKKEHEEVLNKGIDEWNEWRRQHYERPDLRGACISQNLINCNLMEAWLHGATFRACDLIGANLSHAVLKRVRFYACDLSGSNFESAFLDETVFAHSILRWTKGLDRCSYKRACSCDHRTLDISWPLPKEFIKGCDLPEYYRDWLAGLYSGGPSCFLSHCSDDRDFAKGVRDDLIGRGIPCWMALTDLSIGGMLSSIEARIRESDKVLVVISEAALGSAWVAREVDIALDEEAKRDSSVLVPISLDHSLKRTTVQWAYELWQGRNVADFWDHENPLQYLEMIRRLVESLKENHSG